LADGLPTISQNETDRRATSAHTHHYENEQEPFKEKSEQVEAKTMWMHHALHLDLR
jgi:hypothetical protein